MKQGSKKTDTDYNHDEAQRRFERLVRTALNTPPKPMKDMPRKKPEPKAKTGEAVKR